MNDLTKEELRTIYGCVDLFTEGSHDREKYYGDILGKLKSMIDNYCEHLWRDSAINAIYCEVCQKHVEYDE